MLRSLLLLCALLPAVQSSAQQKFQINGRLKIENGDLTGSRIVVYKDGQKERVINSGLNKFSLDLGMNANYILSFEKDGFVSKKLSFNTKIPSIASMMVFTPFDFAVSLFKQYDDLNMVVFNQPVGVIRYEPGMNDFDYDTDYTKSIQSQLQQAIADVERKQKEESQNAAAEAKRKAAEDKALAKAKAEAEQQAIAKAKAEAEAEQAAAQAKVEADRKAAELVRIESEKKAAALAKADADKKAAEQIEQQPKSEAKKVAKVEPPKAPVPQVAEVKKSAPPPVASTPAPKPGMVPTPDATPKRPIRDRTPVRTSVASKSEQAEIRRYTEPVIRSEVSPMKQATMQSDQEGQPVVEVPEVWTDRKEELFVEPNKVMTVVQLTTGDVMQEYRKVIHKWGGTFYFKNGLACSQVIYETEAMSDRLAGATPRSKFE